MAFYIFSCDKCGNVEEIMSSISSRPSTITCSKCSEQMCRNYTLEQQGGTLDSLNNEHPRYSISGGVLDEDLETAKKVHPHISDWKKFGNSWRPLIRNRSDKIQFMKQCSAVEYE